MIETEWREITDVDSYVQWDAGEVIWDGATNVTGVLWDAVRDETTWTEQT